MGGDVDFKDYKQDQGLSMWPECSISKSGFRRSQGMPFGGSGDADHANSVNTGAKPPPGVRKFVVCPW